MKILHVVILIFLFLNFYNTFSQNIDSLENILEKSSGKNRISILRSMAKLYTADYPHKSASHLGELLFLLEKYPNDTIKAEVYSLSGKSQYYIANYDSALLAWKTALKIYKTLKYDKGIAEQYNNLGVWYYKKAANYELALDFYLKSLRQREKIYDTIGIAYSLNNVGNIYFKQKRRNKAIKSFEKALNYAKTTKDKKIISILLNNLGAEYAFKGEYDKSLEYYFKSVKIKKELNNKTGIALTYGSIAGTYSIQKKYKKALEYFHKAIDIFKKTSNKYNLAMILSITAEVYAYREIEDYEKAIKYLKKSMAIAEEINARSLMESDYLKISHIYSLLKNYEQAYLFQKKYIEIHDSIYTQESDLRMKEAEIKYETEKKENENEILKRKQEINELTIEKNANRQYFLIVISIIMLFFAGVIYNRYRYKQKINKELEYTNKKLTESEDNLKELIATKDKFFSIIAHDLRSPLSSLTIVSEMLDENIENISSEKLVYYIGSISKATSSLLNLVENLLNWARTQTNKIKYNPEKINLTEIVEQNISLLKINADKKNIVIKNGIRSDIFVTADINLLTAVVRNLLANAVKFTENNGKINIDVSEIVTHYKIAIKDTGIGITKNDLEKLFRIDVDTRTIGTSTEKGTGLGLILCKEFVEKNGGEIYVESKQKIGSTFYFTVRK